MQQAFTSFAGMVRNIRRTLALAYEIDPHLIRMYFFTSFLGGLMPVITAYMFRFLIDRLVSFHAADQKSAVAAIIVAILGGYYLSRFIELVGYWGLNVSYYDFLLRNKLQSGLMYRFNEKLASLDLEHLENSQTQNLIQKVSDSYLWKIPDLIRIWNYTFSNLVSIVTTCIVLSPFGWWIPFVIVIVTIPRFYMKLRHGNFVWSMFGSGAPEGKKLWYLGWLLRSTTSILETRIFQSQQAILDKIATTQDYLYKLNKKPLDNYRWVLIFAPLLESIAVFSILYHFLPQGLTGVLTVGELTFLISTLETLRNSVSWGAANLGDLYESNLFIAPFFELLELPRLITEDAHPYSFKTVEPPTIEFRNVSFHYPSGRPAIKNVSFTIHPGENVAFVGNNGAGKTTIIKLLCRFYDVSDGEILINGVNIKRLKLSSWYEHLGTLFQDFMKYNFTIRENIMLGKPGYVNEKRMIEAAKQSGAYEFIRRMPKKFDQMLGKQFEDGDDLSGGQWQKLAIARAFYQQAPVLIMDEPTSAIDAEAEYEIFNNLEKLYKDKTLILVSHRFSTVRNANKIIVIDRGQLVEQGTHHELLTKNGKYAAMFRVQAKGYE